VNTSTVKGQVADWDVHVGLQRCQSRTAIISMATDRVPTDEAIAILRGLLAEQEAKRFAANPPKFEQMQVQVEQEEQRQAQRKPRRK
jgi:hypothetical protein